MILCFHGDPRTKKNHQQIRHAGNRMWVAQADTYTQFEKDCLWQIPNNCRLEIDYPVNVKCLFYLKTKRRVDLNNLEAAIMDILVKGRVLSDDHIGIVQSKDGTRAYYDKKNPRVEVYIEVAK